nr:response regulator [Kofleriaceae bacterium]
MLSWSLIGPIQRTEARLAEIAAGDFTGHLDVPNRDELGSLGANVNRMNDELQRVYGELETASRHKSEFHANMSHELRTPLNAIIGFAELLYDGQVEPGTPMHQEFLGDILSSGRHLLQLINDVLDLAKVESGKLDLRPESCDPGQLAREVVGLLRTSSAAKRLRVDVDIDDAVGRAHIDPGRFKQVVYNFVSNAIKFTPDGGDVTVRVVPELGDPRRFRLDVRDTGVGIAAEDMDRLFVEFQQLESGAAKRHQGTGLGLALTKRLIEAQGGTVGVASELGAGSTFHAVLPRQVAGGLAGKVIAAPAALATTARPGTPIVLVVEDEQADRELLVDALTAAGFEVDAASTGAEAISRCATRDYDAITLDMLLPDVTGVDLLAALRADARLRDVPVVVITIVPASETRRVVAAYAVHDVVDKPIAPAALLASLARAGVRPDRRGGVLVVDDDPSALRLMDAALAQRGLPSITRSSGASALEAAVTLAPSAFVVDLIMPGMDGIQFLDALRALPEHARTPVVVWTMKDLSVAERERLGRSAQGVVAKGDSPLGVVHQLQALLGGT